MFDKNLTVPIPLLQAEALERRLEKTHDKLSEIKTKIRILKSGYNGEKEINYQLGQIPHHKYHIFHDLRLPIGKAFFQIDALLLSPNILMNLEGKNHSGKITIEKNQMIQESFDTREVYENPVSQANRHTLLMKYWLEINNVPKILIDNLVVFSRPSSEIIISPGYKESEKKICKTHDLLKRIEEIEGNNKKVWIDEQDILKVSDLFLKKHTPKREDVLTLFQIPDGDIITGVQCPTCLFIPMIYNRHKWICSACNCISKDAHLAAVNDYFLIIKPALPTQRYVISSTFHPPEQSPTSYPF